MTDWRGDLLKIGIIPDDMPDQTNFVLFNLDELANHMIKELDKAREEGVKDGMRGMIDILCEKGCGSMFAVIEEKDVNKKIEELSKLTTK